MTEPINETSMSPERLNRSQTDLTLSESMTSSPASPLPTLPVMRIGLLAASRISVRAIIEPATVLDGVEVAAVAARSIERAERFAEAHRIPVAYGSYEELVADSTLDAVYIGTPNSLHASWAIKCLEAGHHVLCEKPLAGNAEDARKMADVSRRTGRVLMEAFHWRFHGFAEEMIATTSRLNRPTEIETVFNVPDVPKDNIRYQHHLGGGALMDLGCYNLHWLRTILGEPTDVVAEMEVSIEEVDDTTRATLSFEDGSVGTITTSFVEPELEWYLKARSDNGWVHAENPLAPQNGNRLRWEIDGKTGDIEVGGPSSYEAQLAAFAALASGENAPTISLEDSINNMTVIDRIYQAAGLGPRP